MLNVLLVVCVVDADDSSQKLSFGKRKVLVSVKVVGPCCEVAGMHNGTCEHNQV